MLFIISKILPVFFYPVGFSLLSAIAAAILLPLRRYQLSLTCIIVTASTLFVFSLPATAHLLLRALERRYEQPENYPYVSAIVLLGGSTHPALPPRRHVEISNAGDRVIHAARLLKNGHAPWLIATGGVIPFFGSLVAESQSMARLLSGPLGVDSSRIIQENKSRNTHDHARYVKEILDSLELPYDILVVTSAAHMHRSIKVFEKAGFNARPAPADYQTEKRFAWIVPQFLPRADALQAVTAAFHEYYGLIAYQLLGWI